MEEKWNLWEKTKMNSIFDVAWDIGNFVGKEEEDIG